MTVNKVGVSNFGNNCSMSVVLQLIFRIKQLFNQEANIRTRQNGVVCSLQKLLQSMLLKRETLNPASFLKEFYSENQHLDSQEQHDAHEYIYIRYKYIENLLNKEFDFQGRSGIMDSIIKCKNCSYDTKFREKFNDLSVSITKGHNLL